MATMKLTFTNGELRSLMYGANTIQSVRASEVFYEGVPAECEAHKEANERTAAYLADAKAIYFHLRRTGKYSEKALKGCPGATIREKWAAEYEEMVKAPISDDVCLTCARCRMDYDVMKEGDAMLCRRCYHIVHPVEETPAETLTDGDVRILDTLYMDVDDIPTEVEKVEVRVTTPDGGESWAVTIHLGERVETLACGVVEQEAEKVKMLIECLIPIMAKAERATMLAGGLWTGRITGEVL